MSISKLPVSFASRARGFPILRLLFTFRYPLELSGKITLASDLSACKKKVQQVQASAYICKIDIAKFKLRKGQPQAW